MGADEEFGEVVPPVRGVQTLQARLEQLFKESRATYSVRFSGSIWRIHQKSSGMKDQF